MSNVFITGANGDIGRAIKDKFISNGYNVTAPTRQELNLENIGAIAEYFKNNNKFDIIIHCAGYNNPKKIEEISYDDILRTANINYISFVEIIKSICPYMKQQKNGRILGISSLYGTISRAERLPYATSKHALNGTVRTLACEFGKYNILVNALSPGFVNTQMTRKNNSVEKIEQIANKIPLKRLANVEEIANVAYFLSSNENTYITGQNLIVDGGFMVEGGQN